MLSPLEALRWQKDGGEQSATRPAHPQDPARARPRAEPVPGPRYWELPTVESLAELAGSLSTDPQAGDEAP